MRIQIVLLVLFASVALRQTPPAREAVLIRTPKPYAHMVAEIQRLGGSVTRQFKYVGRHCRRDTDGEHAVTWAALHCPRRDRARHAHSDAEGEST